MRQIALIIGIVVISVSAVVLGFAFFQVQSARADLAADLQYRTHLLADGLKESIEPSFANYSTSTLQGIIDRFANRERLVGLALYDTFGSLIAASEGLSEETIGRSPVLTRVVEKDEAEGGFASSDQGEIYFFAQPLHQGGVVAGVFVVVQKASYINESILSIWRESALHILVQVVVFSAVVILLIWWLFFRHLRKLAEQVRSARQGK
jgi:hypothetical protein